MVKFYGIPLLTAGGFVYDYTAPKREDDTKFHLLVKTGPSYAQMVDFTYRFFTQ